MIAGVYKLEVAPVAAVQFPSMDCILGRRHELAPEDISLADGYSWLDCKIARHTTPIELDVERGVNGVMHRGQPKFYVPAKDIGPAHRRALMALNRGAYIARISTGTGQVYLLGLSNMPMHPLVYVAVGATPEDESGIYIVLPVVQVIAPIPVVAAAV